MLPVTETKTTINSVQLKECIEKSTLKSHVYCPPEFSIRKFRGEFEALERHTFLGSLVPGEEDSHLEGCDLKLVLTQFIDERDLQNMTSVHLKILKDKWLVIAYDAVAHVMVPLQLAATVFVAVELFHLRDEVFELCRKSDGDAVGAARPRTCVEDLDVDGVGDVFVVVARGVLERRVEILTHFDVLEHSC